ncbi:MAG: DUF4157 domain-containing protein [Bacteroidota bacterium]
MKRPIVQAKQPSSTASSNALKIGASNDRYEREADAMADRVMRMPQRFSGQALSAGPAGIQRKCAACEHEEEQIRRQPLMRPSSSGGAAQATPALQSQLRSSRGSGHALPTTTQGFMNQAFNTDFSHVRIHTDQRAARMSQGLRARAFTYGPDIYFNRGQYNPQSRQGQHLLSHELTHVVQQSGGRNAVQRSSISDLDELLIQRQAFDALDPRSPGPLPYREATELAECTRIMGEESYEYCYEQVLGRHPNPEAARQRAIRNAALAASCSHEASNLSWSDYTVTTRRRRHSAFTDYDFSTQTVSGQQVIRVDFSSRGSYVRRKFANPGNRSLNGCARGIEYCHNFFEELARTPGGVPSQYPTLGGTSGRCPASIGPDTSLEARSDGECETVLGAECDRAAAAESSRLLRHEQYHFAVGCIMARKGTQAILDGQDVAQVFAQVRRHDSAQIISYDNDTNHGCDQAEQDRWEADIDAGLPNVQITTSP